LGQEQPFCVRMYWTESTWARKHGDGSESKEAYEQRTPYIKTGTNLARGRRVGKKRSVVRNKSHARTVENPAQYYLKVFIIIIIIIIILLAPTEAGIYCM
jgi:hypothetical protein